MNRRVIALVKNIEVEATLIGFGIDFDELGNGVAHFTVGIIELEDGSVVLLPVNYFKFVKE